ncbi:ECM25 [Candida metapsilosis]|uniref:ECM25 n=1 Tax=Candida metapsilosis TaxID=273372 RepID=A0A8H8DCU0_9ASCO|nr:ECM25 [Candida metapsilosis]
MDRIFYHSPSIRDPITKHPIYIFDTSYLPPTDSINYDNLIPVLMQQLPLDPYVLVMFSSGLNKISWVWGLKFIKNFMSNAINLNNLVKVFTVHDSWFIKSVTSVIHNYHTTKHNIEVINYMLDAFAIEPKGQRHIDVVHCRTLSELSHYLNITLLKISLNIYKYDQQLENELKLSIKVPPVINPHVLLSPQTNPTFYHHVYQLLNIIDTHCCKKELIFYTPGKRDNIDILYQCVLRNQLIWINDWDLYCIATVFKKILSDLPFALIPYKLVLLPIQDDFEYTQAIFNAIITSHQQYAKTINYDQLLLQLFQVFAKLVSNESTTKHNITTIAKCMAHCLSHEVVSTDTSHILVVQRFIKNVLHYWDKVKLSYEFPSIEDVLSGKNQPDSVENAYDMSYEVTYEEEDEYDDDDDDENRVLFNTSNILYSNTELELEENTTPTAAAHKVSSDSLTERRIGRPSIQDLKSPLRASHRAEEFTAKSPPRPPRPASRANAVTSRDLSPNKNRQPKEAPPPIPPARPTSRQVSADFKDQTRNGTTISNGPTEIEIKHNIDEEDDSTHNNDENVAPISSLKVLNKPSLHSIGSVSSLGSPRSPKTPKSPRSSRSAKSTSSTLTNVSNLQLQYPPQKYHFTRSTSTTPTSLHDQHNQVDIEHQNVDESNMSQDEKLMNKKLKMMMRKKKPVIRGRKVSQLAKLFEERSEGLEILNSM